LINHFTGLGLYLVSYIKMELFSPIPEPLGLAILLNIGWMGLSILLKVACMVLEPEFDPRVIGMTAIGMLLSPAGTVVSVEGLLTGGSPTGFPLFPYPRIDGKELFAIRTLFRFHLGFPSALE
jgi:hypothetical protein